MEQYILLKLKVSSPQWATKNFSVLNPIEKETDEENYFEGMAHLKTQIEISAADCLASNVLPVDKKNWYIPV